MSKRKPPPSKHARNSKTATKAQRAAQAVVKSPKDSRFHSIVADPTEPRPRGPNETEQEALLAENPAAAVQTDEIEQEPLNETKQEPLLVENPATALEPNDTRHEERPESRANARSQCRCAMFLPDVSHEIFGHLGLSFLGDQTDGFN